MIEHDELIDLVAPMGWTVSASADRPGLYDVYGPDDADGPRMVLARDIDAEAVRALLGGRVTRGTLRGSRRRGADAAWGRLTSL